MIKTCSKHKILYFEERWCKFCGRPDQLPLCQRHHWSATIDADTGKYQVNCIGCFTQPRKTLITN